MNVELGYLSQVDGSVRYQNKNSTVICGITGPIEPKARQELPTELALEINIRPTAGVPTTREVQLQDKVNAVLTPVITRYLYPRKLCQISLQILESGENESLFNVIELTSCINSTTLALIDAAIALNSLAIAISIAAQDDGSLIIDPNNEQLESATSIHVLALELVNGSSTVKNVLLLDSHGDFDEKLLFKILEEGEKHILNQGKEFRRIIQQKVEKDLLI